MMVADNLGHLTRMEIEAREHRPQMFVFVVAYVTGKLIWLWWPVRRRGCQRLNTGFFILGVCRNEFGGPARLHRKSTERCIAKYIANRIDCDLGFKCAHVADSDPLVPCFCCSLGGLRAQFSPKQLQQVGR